MENTLLRSEFIKTLKNKKEDELCEIIIDKVSELKLISGNFNNNSIKFSGLIDNFKTNFFVRLNESEVSHFQKKLDNKFENLDIKFQIPFKCIEFIDTEIEIEGQKLPYEVIYLKIRKTLNELGYIEFIEYNPWLFKKVLKNKDKK